MDHKAVISTPIGNVLLICDDEHLKSVSFLASGKPASIKHMPEIMHRTIKQFTEYFAGKRRPFNLPIDVEKLDGTAFQKKAWSALLKIPYGETISYKKQAENIGHPNAQRAVGQANGKNPLPIIIPCHRVVASDGRLGGFSSGLWRKEFLLKLECNRQPA